LPPTARMVAPVAAFFFAALTTGGIAGGSDQSHQKDAFESAKELGSADAWNAFLNAYPSGFYADMARAYLKKLDGETAAPAAPARPAVESHRRVPELAGVAARPAHQSAVEDDAESSNAPRRLFAPKGWVVTVARTVAEGPCVALQCSMPE